MALLQQILDLLSERWFQIILTTIASAVISTMAIPVIIRISRFKNLMDEPGHRSSHDRKTPTLGGIAIFGSVLISYFAWENPDGGALIHLVTSAVVILFFLGMKDDILVLAPKKKLYVQMAVSAVVIVAGNLRLDSLFGIWGINEIPYLISVPLTIFVFIALINAFNLIDGIDGLAGSIAMIAAGAFGLWFYANGHYAFACLASSIVGSMIGFLRFNFSQRYKIFMGDTGSMILGFLLTVFAVKFVQLNETYIFDPNAYFGAPILALVVLIVPIFDTLRVFMTRIKNKKSPFVGDRNHAHHLLIDNGLSHQQATAILSSFNITMICIFLMLDKIVSNTQAVWVLAGIFIVYVLTCNWLKNRIKLLDAMDNEATADVAGNKEITSKTVLGESLAMSN
jgi:UDP-GlcNAc:undecaprenyl-phosphate/decaprenyl-phosphate GlcNAc-1-phosphate transferase